MDIAFYKSPLGIIQIEASGIGISRLSFIDNEVEKTSEDPIIRDCFRQLRAYFSGNPDIFDLQLDIDGTAFQKNVWKELLKIPMGKTISYMDLAKRLGDPHSIRALAHANGQNPIPIIIPCHRVIGSGGSLTGYVGGLWRKKWLLEHERDEKQGRLFE